MLGPEGAELDAVVRQPKRLALFLYLLLSERRFHRRDSLLALFWPDHDDGHARAALRRSLHFLRIHLGAAAIDTRGDDVGVPSHVAWCDATAFDEALRTGKYEEALQLYRGDLLEGVHIESAPDVGRWLDETRARHRREAVRAALTLADTAEKAGDPDGAVRWSGRAAQLAEDEDSMAAHLQRLGRLHRGTEAQAAYRRYADRLATTLELEPSAALRALADRAATAREDRHVASALRADVIAVFPFSVRGLPELEYLREGMVDLLSAKLDAAGSVRTVDPYALLRHVRQAGAPDDAAGARAIAAAFEAGSFVLGSVVAEGDRVHATAILYETDGSGEVRAHVESPRESGPFGFVDALTLQMLTHGRRQAQVWTLTAAVTQSLPALKHYLVGEERFRLSRYDESRVAFAEAIALDPAFALAHYRHAAAAAACGAADDAIAASRAAVVHRERLGTHDRLLLDAQAAWFAGDAETAEVLWERVIGEWPDDVQAWFLLGNLQFDFNPMRGRSSTEARAAFAHTLELDPNHVSALVHLARIEAMERRVNEVTQLAQRVEALSPGSDHALAVRGVVVFSHADRSAQLAWLGTLAGRRLPTLARVVADIVLYSSDVASRDWLAREVPRLAPAGTLGVLEQVVFAYVAAAHGDPATINEAFGRATAQSPGQSLLHRAFLAMVPTRARDRDTVTRVRQALEAWSPGEGPPAPQPNVILALIEAAQPLLRAYVLGLAAAWLEDESAAVAQAEICRTMAPPHLAPRLPAQLGAGIRARLALVQGRPEETLRQLDGLGWPGWPELAIWSPFHGHAAERLLRAEALAAVGRHSEAATWALGLGQRSPYDLAFRGEAERLGLIPTT